MKKLLWIWVAILVTACGGVEHTSYRNSDAADADAELIGTKRGAFNLAGIDDYFGKHPEIAAIEASIQGADSTQLLRILPGKSSESVLLMPDTYRIEVAAMNAEGGIIRTGSADFDIRPAETTQVEIALFLTKGELDVTLVDGETPPEQPAPTIHALGVYQSRGDHSFGYHPMGDLRVTIKGEGPVVLLLGSYEPTNWIIVADPGVEIRKVVALGYHTQKVTGVDSSLVMTGCYEAGCMVQDYSYFYKHPSTQYDAFFKKATGYADVEAAEADAIQSAYESQAYTINL